MQLIPLFYLIPRVLRALGAPVFMMPGFEADDVMATVGQWARQRLVAHKLPNKETIEQ